MKEDLFVTLEQKGFVISPEFFSQDFITELKQNISRYLEFDHPGIVREEGSNAYRGIHGMHLYDQYFENLSSNKELKLIAQRILKEECYLHQFKINMKQKMEGHAWPWHEDYVYWNKKDGIEEPKLINIAIFLDDSNMLNGPLCFIPGSHKHSYSYLCKDPESLDWQGDLAVDLNFKIDIEVISDLIKANDVEFATGGAGDLLIFNPLAAHCSSSNLSPFDRRILILTYNASSNAPTFKSGRPEFLCGVPDKLNN